MKIAELKTSSSATPARFRRPLFPVSQAQDRLRIEGVGEVYAASFAPKAIVALIEDVPRHVEGQIRSASSALAQCLWARAIGRPTFR
jgi:hypothetical protein